MKTIGSICVSLVFGSLGVSAQSPDASPSSPSPPPSAAPAPASPGGAAPKKETPSSAFGNELPMVSPGNEVVSWNGKHWNVLQNRLFEARFEKYLNAPEETNADAVRYQELIRTIIQKLGPDKVGAQSLDEAYRLLPQASSFDIDSHLCDALADAIYSMWLARNEQTRLSEANKTLEKERGLQEWNVRQAAKSPSLFNGGNSKANTAAAQEWAKQQEDERAARMAPPQQRLAEINAKIGLNKARKELSEIQAKIEFQGLIVQFLIQRRFQHVLMATRFYRNLTGDGDTSLKLAQGVKDDFERSVLGKATGLPTTLGTIDTMANEAIRDVREGVEAYKYLLEKQELESGTKRLQEAFVIGEYLPEIRTLPRELKRQSLLFTQKANQLLSAIDVKDYALVDSLLKELAVIAKDFDNSKPRALVETAKVISSLHLTKARNAALNGDQQTLKSELEAAVIVWPRNPALTEFSTTIFSQGNDQAKALSEFDLLVTQHNYRQIFSDKLRFIAASAFDPSRQQQLRKVLEDMQAVETAIARATEIEKRGDSAGAWEGVELAYKQFPEDTKLNQLRANLTTRSADFVRTLITAQQLEEKQQIGSSLAWYLKAQQIYPPSELAKGGIERLTKRILPNGGA